MEEEEAQLPTWSRHPVVEAALKCYGHDLVAARCMVEWPAMAAHNTLHTIPRHATAMHVSVGFFGQCARAKYACRQRLEEEEEEEAPPSQQAGQAGQARQQQQHLLSASELCPQMVAVGETCVGVNVAAGCTRLHGGQIRWGRVSRVLVNGEVVTHTSGLVREGEQGSEVLWQGDHRLYVNAAVAVGDHLRLCLGGSQWIALRVGGFRQSKAVCHASQLLRDLGLGAAEPMLLLPCGSPMLFNVADIDVPHGEMAFAVDAVRLLLHEWDHFRGDEVVYKTGGRGMHIVAPHYDVLESVEVPCLVAEPYTIRIPKESYRYWMAQCAHIGVIHTHAKPRTWQIATCRMEGDYVVLGVDGWDETVGDRMPNPLYEQRVGVPATIERRKMRPRVEDYLLSKHPTSVLNRMHVARLHHCSQSHGGGGGGHKRKRTRGGEGGGGKAATPMDTMAHFRSMIDRLGRSPNHLLKLGSAERTPTRVFTQPRGERHLVDVPGTEPREIFGNADLFRRIHYAHEVKMESHLRKAVKGWRGLAYEDDPAFASTSS